MATILYKGGKRQKFPAHRVQGALKAGWSTTKDGLKKDQPKPPEKAKPELSEQEIRDLAKQHGISNYWNKKLENLKEELGL